MDLPRRDHCNWPYSAIAAPYRQDEFLDEIHTIKPYLDEQSELLAVWEDQMDALGSSPSIEDLQRLVDLAPEKSHPLHCFAIGVLVAMEFA